MLWVVAQRNEIAALICMTIIIIVAVIVICILANPISAQVEINWQEHKTQTNFKQMKHQ